MKDVTQILNKYRECIRNLWNIYFITHASPVGAWDVFDDRTQGVALGWNVTPLWG